MHYVFDTPVFAAAGFDFDDVYDAALVDFYLGVLEVILREVDQGLVGAAFLFDDHLVGGTACTHESRPD